jgi:hypothetical protein
LNNIKRETSRYFTKKKREYLKEKIVELAAKSKNKNMRDVLRGIKVCKWGYLPRSNLVNTENGDLLADSNKVLNRWKIYLSKLLVLYALKLSEIQYSALNCVP